MFQHTIVHHALRDIHGIQQLHAARQHSGQRAREPRDGDQTGDLADEWNLEQPSIGRELPRFRLHGPTHRPHHQNHPTKDHDPIVCKKMAEAH